MISERYYTFLQPINNNSFSRKQKFRFPYKMASKGRLLLYGISSEINIKIGHLRYANENLKVDYFIAFIIVFYRKKKEDGNLVVRKLVSDCKKEILLKTHNRTMKV